jgi:hypothetical protein
MNSSVEEHAPNERQTNALLDDPYLKVDWDEAARLFEFSTVAIVARAPENLMEFPDLPTRLRGALGRALFNYGPAIQHRHDPFNRPKPYDFLYSIAGMIDPRTPIPKPISIRSHIVGKTLNIQVRLLGQAQIYAPQVASALCGALEDGISLSADHSTRVPVRVSDCYVQKTSGLHPPKSAGFAVLAFNTPLCVRSKNLSTWSDRSFVFSMLNRTRGLCRWLDLELDDAGFDAGIIAIDRSQMQPVKWFRHSIRQKGNSIEMSGLAGRLTIKGDLTALWAPLSIAELFGMGSHATLGMGAFDMSIYPS